MTVPQSLLVVALALAWLIVLVPSSSRRRQHVREVVDGTGFRVLRRPESNRAGFIGRRPGSTKTTGVTTAGSAAKFDSEGQMASQQTDVGDFETGSGTGTEATADSRGQSDTVVLTGSHPYDDSSYETRFQDNDPTEQLEPIDDGMTAADAGYQAEQDQADHLDDADLRAQYAAWRRSTRTAEPETEEAAVRPIPRRPGRGTYDPEAAERARAYKYARRRRTLLVLLVITAAFTVTAVTLSPKLWIGAGAGVVLLALFLTYLRRQVRIENDIRERRLAKLQRALQIRPERSQAAGQAGDPYAQRAPRPSQAPGPVNHRVVVDLDDDDPGFDDLEQYEPMEYRRAVGQ